MKYLAKSADALNEAAAFELKMSWIMFSSEQNVRLFDSYDPETKWRPGDPMYPDPRYTYNQYCGCGCEDEDLDRYVGHHVRPMYQLMPSDAFHCDNVYYLAYQCGECDVEWDEGYVCWCCGTDYSDRYKTSQTNYMRWYAEYDRRRGLSVSQQVWADLEAQIREGLADRMREQMVEWTNAISNLQQNLEGFRASWADIFSSRLVAMDAPAQDGPNVEYVDGVRLELPADLDLTARRIPTFEIENQPVEVLPQASWQSFTGPSWRRQ